MENLPSFYTYPKKYTSSFVDTYKLIQLLSVFLLNNPRSQMPLTRSISILLFFLNLSGIFCQQSINRTVFFPEGGFYKDSLSVELLFEGAKVYYTTDGSIPSRKSKIYQGPILLTQTSVIRTIAYIQNKRVDINAQTYFINEPETKLMVVSLALPLGILFNKKYGLFMTGNQVDSSNWKLPTANFWKKTEVLCNLELFEPNGDQVINQLSGFRIFGGMSRIFPQKSIALTAREKYGTKKFDYPVFGKKAPKKFKFLVLRNSGSDWGKSHFRDGLITSLVSKWDIDIQAYRPAHVYINGKYWGIYNIREKINRYFLSSHHGLNKDSINLMEHKMNLKFGSSLSYHKMMRFIKTHDFRSNQNLKILETMMDIDNFMNYQIAEIYCDNQDAGGNIKYWKPKKRNGKWRWILFDTDFGFGLHNPDAYRMNTLVIHTDPFGPGWPNPPWSTFILRKLLKNKGFRQKFITRFCDHLNDSFSSSKVLNQVKAIEKMLLPEIPRHLERWNLKRDVWNEQVEIIKLFAAERPLFMRIFLRDMFNPGKECLLHLEQNEGGNITINNTIDVDSLAFEGIYFQSLPIKLEAKQGFGYLFDHWEGPGLYSTSNTIFVNLNQPVNSYRAVYKAFKNEFVDKLVINEISNANSQSGDWIELYNAASKNIDLEGWILKDTKNQFTLPAYILKSGEYLVICQNLRNFKRVHRDVQNVIGSFNFGLSKTKETIQLFSADRALVDKTYYELTPGDSLTCLALLLPQLDNQIAENWIQKIGIGSPGAINPFLLRSSVIQDDDKWITRGALVGTFIILMILLFWWNASRRIHLGDK